jgi:hypothetical protein
MELGWAAQVPQAAGAFLDRFEAELVALEDARWAAPSHGTAHRFTRPEGVWLGGLDVDTQARHLEPDTRA